MIIPLDKLISFDSNVYAMTCSSIKRAVQITVTGEEEIVENNGKVVSTALKQILTEKVKYRLVE